MITDVWVAVVAVIALCQCAVLATSVYLHRTLTHRALVMHPVADVAFRTVLWLTTGQRRREWVAVHRKHHAFTDRDGDPHSPRLLGLWRILLFNVHYYMREARNPETLARFASDVPDDRLERAIFSRGWAGLALGIALLCLILGTSLGLLVALAHAVLYVVVVTPLINGVGHWRGGQNFTNTARNSRVLAWMTGGESLHNNHHAHPRAPKFSVRRSEFDPSWMGIRVLAALRMVIIVGSPVRLSPVDRVTITEPAARHPPGLDDHDDVVVDPFYAVVRVIARFWIWFFFERIEVRHPERVPPSGSVLLCINHPNNLIDSLLVGSVLPRKVHYLATATLFRNPLVARLLFALGVIPVYRKADDPDKMDRNEEAFAACDQAFDRGRLIAIYPEGATHAEAHVQRIKTGAARIALGYEAHAPGRLTVLPVGLTFEARKRFRGRVLVSYGEPVALSPYLAVYREKPVKALHALTLAIQRAMEREVVHVERIDTAALARAVEELYRGELERDLWEERGFSGRQIDPFQLSGSIAEAVEQLRKRDPERIERLWQRILGYRALLDAYRLRDEAVRTRLAHTPARRRVARSWQATVGLPLFVYGSAVNFLPYYLPGWLARRMARRETDYATIRLLASVVAFPLFWTLETSLVGWAAGLRWALAFFLSLPLGGLIAYRYLVGTERLRRQLRFGALLLTRAQEARRLLAERRELVEELELARRDYLHGTKRSSD